MRWLLVLAACGGSVHQIDIGPPPEKATRGTFAGPLCGGPACKCRDANATNDGGAGFPTDDRHKRFELRLGPSPQQLWATLPGTVLYKSAEHAEECFYVDLPSGDLPVELRASDPTAVEAQWSIHELGTKTKSWYDTFAFHCGAPGACSVDALEIAKSRAAGLKKKGVYDACGSVKIKALEWDKGRPPDMVHPTELVVRFVMQVYQRAPTHPSGADCSKYEKGEGRGGEEPPPTEESSE